jgi:hypothetical protein
VELLDLAQNYFGDTRASSLAGPIGGFLIAALAVGTILLIRNMNARIRRLPASFDPPDGPDGSGDQPDQVARR